MSLYPAVGPAQRFKRYIKQKTSIVDSVATSCHVSPTLRISGLCSAIQICNSAMLDIRHITFTETIRTVAMLEVKRCLPQCPGFTADVGQGKTKSLSAKLSRERERGSSRSARRAVAMSRGELVEFLAGQTSLPAADVAAHDMPAALAMKKEFKMCFLS